MVFHGSAADGPSTDIWIFQFGVLRNKATLMVLVHSFGGYKHVLIVLFFFLT